MHFLLLFFLVSLSINSPVPDDSSDLFSLTGFGEVDVNAKNLIHPLPTDQDEMTILSPNSPGFGVSDSLNESANPNSIALCARDSVDIYNKNDPSDQSEIAQPPANSCPANTNTTPSESRLNHKDDQSRHNIKCPETKKGEPFYYQLCCWDVHVNRLPSLRPRGLSYHSSDREIIKRAGTRRTHCSICMFFLFPKSVVAFQPTPWPLFFSGYNCSDFHNSY